MTNDPENNSPEATAVEEKGKEKTLKVIKTLVGNLLLLCLAIVLVVFIYGTWQLKDRHPDIPFELNAIHSEGAIKAGFAALPILSLIHI